MQKNKSLVAFHQKASSNILTPSFFLRRYIQIYISIFTTWDKQLDSEHSLPNFASSGHRVVEVFFIRIPIMRGSPGTSASRSIHVYVQKLPPCHMGSKNPGKEFQNHSEDWHLAHPGLKKNRGKWHLESKPQAHAQGGVGTQKTSHKLWVLQTWYQIIVQVQKKCITITK